MSVLPLLSKTELLGESPQVKMIDTCCCPRTIDIFQTDAISAIALAQSRMKMRYELK